MTIIRVNHVSYIKERSIFLLQGWPFTLINNSLSSLFIKSCYVLYSNTARDEFSGFEQHWQIRWGWDPRVLQCVSETSPLPVHSIFSILADNRWTASHVSPINHHTTSIEILPFCHKNWSDATWKMRTLVLAHSFCEVKLSSCSVVKPQFEQPQSFTFSFIVKR